MKKIKDNIDKLKNNNFIKEILAINEHIYLVNAMYYGVRDSQIQNIYFILFLFLFQLPTTVWAISKERELPMDVRNEMFQKIFLSHNS